MVSESTPFAAPVQEWKKKKGWGPVALLTAVLLGVAFLAGTRVSRTNSLRTRTTGSLSSTGVNPLRPGWYGNPTLGVPSNDCGVGLTPKSCPLGQETWSVSGRFTDKSHCLSDTGATEICGELCIDPSFLLEFLSYMPFSPKPQKGSCVDHKFTHATGKTFNLSSATKGHIGLDSYIFTKKNKHGGYYGNKGGKGRKGSNRGYGKGTGQYGKGSSYGNSGGYYSGSSYGGGYGGGYYNPGGGYYRRGLESEQEEGDYQEGNFGEYEAEYADFLDPDFEDPNRELYGSEENEVEDKETEQQVAGAAAAREASIAEKFKGRKRRLEALLEPNGNIAQVEA